MRRKRGRKVKRKGVGINSSKPDNQVKYRKQVAPVPADLSIADNESLASTESTDCDYLASILEMLSDSDEEKEDLLSPPTSGCKSNGLNNQCKRPAQGQSSEFPPPSPSKPATGATSVGFSLHDPNDDSDSEMDVNPPNFRLHKPSNVTKPFTPDAIPTKTQIPQSPGPSTRTCSNAPKNVQNLRFPLPEDDSTEFDQIPKVEVVKQLKQYLTHYHIHERIIAELQIGHAQAMRTVQSLEPDNIELKEKVKKYELMAEKERARAEHAWRTMDITKLECQVTVEGATQSYFLKNQFSAAVDKARAEFDQKERKLVKAVKGLNRENIILSGKLARATTNVRKIPHLKSLVRKFSTALSKFVDLGDVDRNQGYLEKLKRKKLVVPRAGDVNDTIKVIEPGNPPKLINDAAVINNVTTRVLSYLKRLVAIHEVDNILRAKTNLEAVDPEKLAYAMYITMVQTEEQEYLANTVSDKRVSECLLIPKFLKLLALLKTLPVDRSVAFMEFFTTQVIPNDSLREMENEPLLVNIGIFLGAITVHLGQPNLGLDMLFNFLLYRPPFAFSFALGLLPANNLIIGYEEFRPFRNMSRKRQAILFAILKNPRFGDARYAKPVIEMIKRNVNTEVPDISFKEFLAMFVRYISTVMDDEQLNNCAHIYAMLVIQRGARYFEGSFTTKLVKWTEMWNKGMMFPCLFACFIISVGIIAEALRRSDVLTTTDKQQEALRNIGDLVHSVIRDSVKTSLQKLIDAAVPDKPLEEWEYERRMKTSGTPVQQGPAAAQFSNTDVGEMLLLDPSKKE